jgi:hypothetical protein
MRDDHLFAENKAPLRDPAIVVAAFVGGDSDDPEGTTLIVGFD